MPLDAMCVCVCMQHFTATIKKKNFLAAFPKHYLDLVCLQLTFLQW